MSDIIRRHESQLALAPEHAKAILKTPSVLVPPEVRPALFECWACHRGLKDLDTPFPLASVLSVWIHRHGLTPADATDILQALQHPDHMAGMNFAGELVSKLAALVSGRLKQRRAEAEAEERRREHKEGERQKAALPEGFSLRGMVEALGNSD